MRLHYKSANCIIVFGLFQFNNKQRTQLRINKHYYKQSHAYCRIAIDICTDDVASTQNSEIYYKWIS